MLGLIKKDMLIVKSNLKFILTILVVYTIISIQDNKIMSTILPVISTMSFISTFSYDEYNNWNAYAITLPKGRENVIKSKYISGIILNTIALILTIITALITSINNGSLKELLEISFATYYAMLILQFIMYPIIFKYGVEKGRIAIFIGVFSMVMLISILKKYLTIPKEIMLLFTNHIHLIFILVVIIILIPSYFITRKIYKQKEF